MKILLTGGNGLLGKCFAKEIVSRQHQLTIAGNNDLSNNAIKIDISDYSEAAAAIENKGFTHIINCAADREPDSCLNNPVRAYTINSAGVENLVRIANKNDITLCHISTNYVFDGKNPPYKEDAVTCPVNVYGRSKLAGEQAAQTASKHLVLRIPALYRTDITDPKNLAYTLEKKLSAGEKITFDNTDSRFYTLADEVAHAAVMLLEKEITGIVHLSAEERTTKAEFAKIFARSRGYDETLITGTNTPAPTRERRPEDSNLSNEYFKTLCDYSFTGPTNAFRM